MTDTTTTKDNVFRLYEQSADDDIAEMNKTYAVVIISNKVAVMKQDKDNTGRPTIEFMPPSHFEKWFCNRFVKVKNEKGEEKFVPLGKYWLHHRQRRQYKGVVFAPGQETPGYFNLWTGFGVEPKQGNCEKFLAHIKDNICRGDVALFNWTMGYFADIARNPTKKKDTSLAWRGKTGTGKTYAAKVFGKLLGNHYYPVSDSRFITGRFNSHMLSCLLLVADEAFWAGDKKAEGRVRDLISGTRHPIELKGYEAAWVDNYLRLLVVGNEDWIVPALMSERRFAVSDVGEEHMQDHSYFGAIQDELDNGGYEALLYYLLHLDLSQVNLRKIPDTTALTEQKIESLNINQRWWLDVLRRGALPNYDQSNRCCATSELYINSYMQRTDKTGQHHRRSMETELGMFLHKMLKGTDFAKKEKPYRYYFPPLKECRDCFDRLMGSKIDWDDQPDWHDDF